MADDSIFSPLPGTGRQRQAGSATADPWRPILPVPDEAPPPPPQRRKRAGSWVYRDGAGGLLGYVRRFNLPDGGKEFLPVTYWQSTATGAQEWRLKGWLAPGPLYGLDRLAQRPTAPVVVVEGEKAADAGAELLPDHVVVTSPGGSQRAEKADWTPLAGRQVVLWPDADDSGAKYADAVAGLLSGITLSVKRLTPPSSATTGWDAADALAEGWSQEQAAALVGAAIAADAGAPGDDATGRSFPLIAFDKLRLGKRHNYLVKGLIPAEGLTLVWGPPKCGKSFWVFDLGMHIALGWDYRGRRVRHGTVVYVALEGERGFAARAEAFRRQFLAEDAGAPQFYLLPTRLDLIVQHGELIADLRAQVGNGGCSAIIIDTLNRSLVGSESSDEDMGAYIKALDELRAAFGCAVIVVHHCGVEGDRPRGHSSLTGAVDAQLSVNRDDVGRVVTELEWLKDGAEGDKLHSELEVVDLDVDEDGEPVTSCVVRELEGAVGDRAPRRKLSAQQRVALDLLGRAVRSHGKELPSSEHVPANTYGVPVELWREHCVRGSLAGSDNPETQQRAFRRALEELQARRAVATWDGWVWVSDT